MSECVGTIPNILGFALLNSLSEFLIDSWTDANSWVVLLNFALVFKFGSLPVE